MNLEQNNIEQNNEETQNFLPSSNTNILISNENEYVINIFFIKI